MDIGRKQLVSAALALGVAACSIRTADIGATRVEPVSVRAYYVPAEQFKTMPFPPPPAPGSDAQKTDLAAVLEWQGRRTEADCVRADEVFFISYRAFLGNNDPFAASSSWEVGDFLKRLDSDAGSALELVKDRFRRPRPADAHKEVRPCIRKSRSYSYPSGHSSYFRLFAAVLGDIMPARRDEFMRKADGMGLDRIAGGVHYPTDIEAGNRFGDRFHALLLASPAYLRDIEKMKSLMK